MENKIVFFIGVPKAGTTTIAALLRQHPDILVSKPKETNFHIHKNNYGKDYYFKTFFPNKKDNQVLIDMSILNMPFSEISAENIYRQFPKAKLIAILRDPVKRAISDYYAGVRTGKEKFDFEKTFHLEKKRKKKDKYPLKARQYFSRGLYYIQIKNFLQYYNKDQFLILEYDHFFLNIEKQLNNITQFLRVNPGFIFNTEIKRNIRSYSIKNKKLNYLLYGRNHFKKLIKPLIPQKVLFKLKNIFSIYLQRKDTVFYDDMDPLFKQKLFHFYKEDIINLKKEFNIPVDHWLQ